MLADTSYSAIKKNTDFNVQQGRRFTRKQIEKYKERRAAEQTETTRAHTASERGVSPKQAGHGTLTDAEQRSRRGADLPRQRAKEKAITAKTAPRDIRGVTQGQRQLRTAANGCLPILWKNAFAQDPCKWCAGLELQDAYRGFNPMPHKACLRNGALWGIFVNVQQTFRKSSDTVSPNL